MMKIWKITKRSLGTLVCLFGFSVVLAGEEIAPIEIPQEVVDPTITLTKPRKRYVEMPDGGKIQSQLVGRDIYERDGIFFHKEWSFKVGVTQLNVPAAKGWANALQFKDADKDYKKFLKLGDRLEGAFVPADSIRTRRLENFGDFIIIVSVPSSYEYAKYNQSSFEKLKETLKEELAEERKDLAEREHFENFDDYVRYRYGDDEDLDTFVDGYRILAVEDDNSISYYFNTHLRVADRKSTLLKNQSVTTSIILVRGKLIKVDIRMTIYDGDTYSRLISFTRQYIDWMGLVNEGQ